MPNKNEKILADSELLRLMAEIHLICDDIEWTMFILFRGLLPLNGIEVMKSIDIAHSLYFVHHNSRARRDMVASLGKAVLRSNSNKYKIFQSLIRRTGKLLQKRNQLTHGFWGSDEGGSEVVRIPHEIFHWEKDEKKFSKTQLAVIVKELTQLHKDLKNFSRPLFNPTAHRVAKKALPLLKKFLPQPYR